MRFLRQPEFWVIVASVAALTAGHYAAPTHDPFWHDLFRRLYYLPIVLAGLRFGLAGGLATALAVSLLFLPHVLATARSLHVQASEARFEIPLYLVVGTVTGLLAGRLRRAERFRAFGTIAAAMAHEIRNPLAAIRSAAQLLGTAPPDRVPELASIVVSEVDRLNRVVSDFLQFARPRPPQKTRVEVVGLVSSCLELLRPVLAQKRISLRRVLPDKAPEVLADPDQLRQVILNLLLNAIHATPAAGEVVVSVAPQPSAITVSISDNGPGIPRAQLSRVFEPFFTTRAGGSGLGLANARRIVSDHGGTLRLESAPGLGTTAEVRLPLGRA